MHVATSPPCGRRWNNITGNTETIPKRRIPQRNFILRPHRPARADRGVVLQGRSLLPEVPVTLQDPDHPAAENNAFVDPWGNAYQYVFFTRQTGTAPQKRGYVLFSFGHRKPNEPLPTRAEVVPRTSGVQGGIVSDAAVNAQNIYADQ